jgi:hypothetical protein
MLIANHANKMLIDVKVAMNLKFYLIINVMITAHLELTNYQMKINVEM